LQLVSNKAEKAIQSMTNLVWEGANSSGVITKELLADVLRHLRIFRIYPGTDTPNKVRAAQETKGLKKLCEYFQSLRKQRSDDPPDTTEPSPDLDASLGSDSEPLNGEMDAADAIDFLSQLMQRSVPTEENKRIHEDTMILTEEERLIRLFIALHQTARAYDTTQTQRSPSPTRYDECTFKPTLNHKSVLMETVANEGKGDRGGTPPQQQQQRFQKLYDMRTTLSEKRAKLQAETEKDTMKACTFSPKVNSHSEHPDGMRKSEALFNISKSKKKNSTEEVIPSTLARDLKHCSFSPNLESARRSLQQLQRQPVTPRGADQFEKRIRQAQQSREELQQLLERPSYPKPSALHAKPPSFLTARTKPEPPLLYVDIKLAHGRTGRVGIHRGDDPKVLAQNFANTFHLESKLMSKLEDMLRLHVENLENSHDHQYHHNTSSGQNNNDNDDGDDGGESYGSDGEYNEDNVNYKDRGYHSDE